MLCQLKKSRWEMSPRIHQQFRRRIQNAVKMTSSCNSEVEPPLRKRFRWINPNVGRLSGPLAFQAGAGQIFPSLAPEEVLLRRTGTLAS